MPGKKRRPEGRWAERYRPSAASMAASALKYLSLCAAAAVTILPILTIFFGSMKSSAEFANTGPFALPRDLLDFSNYATAFTKGKMLLGFGNTLVLILFSAVGTVFTGTMSAYVLHRFEFRLKKLVMGLFLLLTLIPSITTQVATFKIVAALGLYNTRAAGIVLSIGTDILALYVYLQFLESIPRSLDESAIIDGAGYFRVYFRIILPLLTPATVTVLIIKCIGVYNDFYTPYLYMPKPSLQVISTALFKFKGPYGARWEIICAGVMIAILPTLAAFIALQKKIYNGLIQGAVKQ
jgi:raffinose/stachyose/melibiose transport system permease protein